MRKQKQNYIIDYVIVVGKFPFILTNILILKIFAITYLSKQAIQRLTILYMSMPSDDIYIINKCNKQTFLHH